MNFFIYEKCIGFYFLAMFEFNLNNLDLSLVLSNCQRSLKKFVVEMKCNFQKNRSGKKFYHQGKIREFENWKLVYTLVMF